MNNCLSNLLELNNVVEREIAPKMESVRDAIAKGIADIIGVDCCNINVRYNNYLGILISVTLDIGYESFLYNIQIFDGRVNIPIVIILNGLVDELNDNGQQIRTLRNIFQSWRAERSILLDYMAEKLNISVGMLVNIEYGKARIPSQLELRILKLLDLDYDGETKLKECIDYINKNYRERIKYSEDAKSEIKKLIGG